MPSHHRPAAGPGGMPAAGKGFPGHMRRRLLRSGAAAAFFALALAPGASAWQGASQIPAEANRPVTSPGNAVWAKDAAEAKAKAAAEKKLIYFEFVRPGCGDCRRMQSLLYPAFDFEVLLTGMVPVKLDIDSAEGKPLAERFGLRDVPAVLIATPEGRLVFSVEGFKNAPDFYRHVHKDLDEYRKFARRIESQDVATLSADEAYATGRELYARRDIEAARPRLKRASVAPDPKPGVRESALEGLAAAELQLGQTAAARQTIDLLIRTTKNAEQKERAELFRAQIPLSENKPAEALALYKQFARDHPESKHLATVRSFIEKLEAATPAPK